MKLYYTEQEVKAMSREEAQEILEAVENALWEISMAERLLPQEQEKQKRLKKVKDLLFQKANMKKAEEYAEIIADLNKALVVEEEKIKEFAKSENYDVKEYYHAVYEKDRLKMWIRIYTKEMEEA